jgi:hypothetical protein
MQGACRMITRRSISSLKSQTATKQKIKTFTFNPTSKSKTADFKLVG